MNRKMGDLSDFERGHIVGACLAGASVTKTDMLVCLKYFGNSHFWQVCKSLWQYTTDVCNLQGRLGLVGLLDWILGRLWIQVQEVSWNLLSTLSLGYTVILAKVKKSHIYRPHHMYKTHFIKMYICFIPYTLASV
jgi:hypothetical protein